MNGGLGFCVRIMVVAGDQLRLEGFTIMVSCSMTTFDPVMIYFYIKGRIIAY